jgi:hypothetical protein
MFVCMYGTYTNSHFWTDLNQTLHTSPPTSGRDRRVYMDPQFLTSSTFLTLSIWVSLQNHGHKIAAGATVFRDILTSVIPTSVCVTSPTWRCRRRRRHPRQPYIRDAARAGVTSRTAVGCAMKTRRSEGNACVWKWKPDETGRKWLINCTCNYIAFIQMIT